MYFIKAALVVLTMIVQVLFCWFIALFVKKDGDFIWLFKWAQPYDTQAIGDEMFHNNEMLYTKNWWWPIRNYWLALHWSGLRNPGWGMMGYMGIKVGEVQEYTSQGPDVDIGDGGYTLGEVKRTAIVNGKKYWNVKKAWLHSETGYGRMLEYGWSLKDINTETKGSIRRLCIDYRPKIKLIGKPK